jgi:hypothetical protein
LSSGTPPPRSTLCAGGQQPTGCCTQQASTITEISDQLSLSIKTISTDHTRILEEVNLNTNADPARYVVEHHLLE